MNIVYKAPCELKPYDKNAKKHDEAQVANVAESIRQYGFVQPSSLIATTSWSLAIAVCWLPRSSSSVPFPVFVWTT